MAFDAGQRLERAADQRFACLREHLHRHVRRDPVLVDQLAHEVVLRLRRRREADLDFLVAEPHQQLEQAQLARGIHRLDQRLVAVAEVDAAPGGCPGDRARGPAAILELDGLVRAVLRILGLHEILGSEMTGKGNACGARLLAWRGTARQEGVWFMCARGAAEAAGRPGGTGSSHP